MSARRRRTSAAVALDIPPTLSIEETMELLKLSRATVDRMRKDGRLIGTRKLGRPRILGASVKALFEQSVAAE